MKLYLTFIQYILTNCMIETQSQLNIIKGEGVKKNTVKCMKKLFIITFKFNGLNKHRYRCKHRS